MKNKIRGMKTVECRTGCGDTLEIAEDSLSGVCSQCVIKYYWGHGISEPMQEDEES